jgi:hypothetical protein
MEEKVEFSSDRWLSLAARVLGSIVAEAGDAIAGQKLTVCEVVLNPPTHLQNDDSNEIAWSFVIDDGKSKVVKRVVEDADYCVRVDYQAALAGARRILGTTPEAIEARKQERRQAAASGRVEVKGSIDEITPAMRLILIELHNRLARSTQ